MSGIDDASYLKTKMRCDDFKQIQNIFNISSWSRSVMLMFSTLDMSFISFEYTENSPSMTDFLKY